jgi:hypothetical protein
MTIAMKRMHSQSKFYISTIIMYYFFIISLCCIVYRTGKELLKTHWKRMNEYLGWTRVEINGKTKYVTPSSDKNKSSELIQVSLLFLLV